MSTKLYYAVVVQIRVCVNRIVNYVPAKYITHGSRNKAYAP